MFHQSPLILFPSSHCSYCVVSIPSPQIEEQWSGEDMLPPVQSQPLSIVQVLLQPSPPIVFPSSQFVPVFLTIIPSPHISCQMSGVVGVPPLHWKPVSTVQDEFHPSPLLMFQSSHSSVPIHSSLNTNTNY